jgi:hypothetical protein
MTDQNKDKDDGLVDPTPLRDRIKIQINELMDLNQRITMVLRHQAQDFEAIGVTYSALSNRAFEISGSIAELAVIAANNTGDIIMAEFALVDDEDEEGDDDGQTDD